MPAIITHHIFGENILPLLPQGIVSGEEETLAFLLGNQGPDPFFARFSTSISRIKDAHALAHAMHDGRMERAFSSLRQGVSRLPQADERLGRAFVLGLLGHWLLDSTVHPFVYAQQYALCASSADLAERGGEIHALIESDLDSWILWQTRHATVLEYPPANELARTDAIGRVASALFARTSLEVFGIALNAEEYARAVDDFELMYRAIEPAGSSRSTLIASVERLFRDSSRLLAQAHKVTRSDECAAANEKRLPWTDPGTGEQRTSSFADLFDDARSRWNELAFAFIKGDETQLARLIDNVNYKGLRTSEV